MIQLAQGLLAKQLERAAKQLVAAAEDLRTPGPEGVEYHMSDGQLAEIAEAVEQLMDSVDNIEFELWFHDGDATKA